MFGCPGRGVMTRRARPGDRLGQATGAGFKAKRKTSFSLKSHTRKLRESGITSFPDTLSLGQLPAPRSVQIRSFYAQNSQLPINNTLKLRQQLLEVIF